MYLLIGIFAIIPLIFSHTFARLWSGFIIDNGIGHFESVKMHFFLFLLVLATIESITQKWQKWSAFLSKKYGKICIFGLLIFFFLGIALYPYENLRDLLLGVGEKQHWLLMPIGLIWLGILLSLLEKSEMRKVGYSIIFSGSIVALIALIEKAGYNIFTGVSYGVEWSWWELRSTSTLWNPNYVAGYLLMISPLILSRGSIWWKYIFLFIVSLGIIATKSIIWIVILSVYILYLGIVRVIPKKVYILLPLLIGLGILLAYVLYGDTEKWLSLVSRFILMKHVCISSLDSSISIIFWHGPDAIIRYFSDIRAWEIDAYFPAHMIIDSSHNLFIDIFSIYGVIGVGVFVYIIIHRWKHLDHLSKGGLILWLSFLSLNVFVISHLMLIVYLLCYTKKASES